MLLDSAEEDRLLGFFEWSDTTLASQSELRERRMKFVAECPAELSDLEIAALLKSNGLYSNGTGIRQIAKTVMGWRT